MPETIAGAISGNVTVSIVRRLEVDFGRRRLAGESARSIKASPAFVAAREDLLDSIFEREAA